MAVFFDVEMGQDFYLIFFFNLAKGIQADVYQIAYPIDIYYDVSWCPLGNVSSQVCNHNGKAANELIC